MKKILVISTGGTIASLPSATGLKPQLSSQDLLFALGIAFKTIAVDTLNLYDIDSTDIEPRHWITLAKSIREHYEKYDGFVITHGTDTLAYTAAALSYLIQNSPKPIVITGAQKSIRNAITDAKTNLKDALIYASYDEADDVVVVFNGKVIAGTRARKARSKSFDAFQSLNYPLLGLVMDQRIVDFVEHRKTDKNVVFYDNLATGVHLLKLAPGLTEEVMAPLLEKTDCLIVESYGLGGIPIGLMHGMKDYLHGHKIVIMSTQVTEEGSDLGLYEVGKRIKDESAIVEARDMTTEAIVTKAMWALYQSDYDRDRFKELFYQRINYDLLKVKTREV